MIDLKEIGQYAIKRRMVIIKIETCNIGMARLLQKPLVSSPVKPQHSQRFQQDITEF